MLDVFEVNENGSFIQIHHYINKTTAAYLKARKMSSMPGHTQICYAISPDSIKRITTLTVNSYILTAERNAAYGVTDENNRQIDRCEQALSALYEAVYPTGEPFASRIFLAGEPEPWMLENAQNAKQELDCIITYLKQLSPFGKESDNVIGEYDVFKKGIIENVKSHCNVFYQSLLNSVWNARLGDSLWDAMAGGAFNPRSWCCVTGDKVSNNDNSSGYVNEVFNPQMDGFFFLDPLDGWQLKKISLISGLLGYHFLCPILTGRVYFCDQNKTLIFSASNASLSSYAQSINPAGTDIPNFYYKDSPDGGWVRFEG